MVYKRVLALERPRQELLKKQVAYLGKAQESYNKKAIVRKWLLGQWLHLNIKINVKDCSIIFVGVYTT
jgi:hypothetical protein